MPLKYPNERLHIYELIVNDGLSGRQALLEMACTNGLLRSEDKVALLSDCGSPCDCLSASQQILEQYFMHRTCCNSADATGFSSVAEDAWKSVLKQYENYNCSVGGTEGTGASQGCCSNSQQRPDANTACRRHCSILFDLILQQIGRYP